MMQAAANATHMQLTIMHGNVNDAVLQSFLFYFLFVQNWQAAYKYFYTIKYHIKYVDKK